MAFGLMERRQVVAKIESQPGVAETLAAGDAKILAFTPRIGPMVDMYDGNPVKKSLGRIAQTPGKRGLGFTFGVLLGGSGLKTTEPEWGKLIKACAHKISTLYSIAIGAITSGPYLHGEEITGGTLGAKGRVIKNTADGSSKIYFVAIGSTAFQSSETITGGESGATSTSSGAPVTEGKCIEPESDNDIIPTLTLASMEDGIRKLLKGARGGVQWNFENAQPCMMNFNFSGVEGGITDLALLTRDFGTKPKEPAFLSAAFTIGTYAAKFKTLSINNNARAVGIDDPSSDRGLAYFKVTDRPITGSFDPLMPKVADHDVFGKWFDGTELELSFVLGALTGNKIEFYAPRCQYIAVDDSDRDGIAAAGINFQLNDHLNMPDTEYAWLLL